MKVPNHEADYNDYLIRLARKNVKRYERSPVMVTPETSKAIDMSGIMRMTADEIDKALEAEAA